MDCVISTPIKNWLIANAVAIDLGLLPEDKRKKFFETLKQYKSIRQDLDPIILEGRMIAKRINHLS
jgi:hypothetical protein